MNCEEFLRQFRDALDGKVSESLIQENVNYYRSYINSQTAIGKNESDVLHSLGDPRLLAKTIEESRKFASENRGGADYGKSHTTYSGNDTYTNSEEEKHKKFPTWLMTCIVVVVILLILSFMFRVFLFLAPYIIVCMLTVFLVRAVRNWWQRK